MLIQTLNRNEPDKVFVIVYNSSLDDLGEGEALYWVDWDELVNPITGATDSTRIQGAGLEVGQAFQPEYRSAGFVPEAQTLKARQFGLMQVYGFHRYCRVSGSLAQTSPVRASAGDPGAIETAAANQSALHVMGCCLVDEANTKPGYAGIFVRCM